MASRQKIAVVVGMLAEAFDRKLSDPMLEAYVIGIGDLPDESLEKACSAVLRGNFTFMPKPGELRALALTGGQGIDSRIDDAWQVLNRAIDRLGIGRSVNFQDALINATVRALGGWERPGLMLKEEFDKWYRKDFRATYARFMQHGCPEGTAGYLPGTNEQHNMKFEGAPLLFEHDEEGKMVQRKPYERPIPDDIAVPYKPLVLSPPAAKQIARRSPDVPRVEFQRAE